MKTIPPIRHFSDCEECQGSDLKISRDAGPEGTEWFAYYIHDIGQGGVSFQVVAEAETEAELRALVGQAIAP